jgi:hypothetical protein
MEQKGLMEVLEASLHDSAFREELLKDHRAALRSRDWELSTEDSRKLDNFMSGGQVADPATILEAFGNVIKGTLPPPPPPWEPIEPRDIME